MASDDTPSVADSHTIASSHEDHVEKSGTSDSSHASDNCRNSALDSHRMNAEMFGKLRDLESGRLSLYPMTSYASQIGGEGGLIFDEDVDKSIEKDPYLVEWDGPNDPENPYNWYVLTYPNLMIGLQSTNGG
jgi:hypothetical protein